MQNVIKFREMRQGEESAVWDVVNKTFDEFIAPTYSPEGVESFYKFVNPDSISQLFSEGYPDFTAIVALFKGKIIGVISFRVKDNCCHITLLFVEKQYHREGVAKGLLNHAIEMCRCHNPNLSEITVNSSPYAVTIYEKLGFQQTTLEQVRDGIRFTPMVLKL
jgi:GNAT superfamily N-acetyltransferase